MRGRVATGLLRGLMDRSWMGGRAVSKPVRVRRYDRRRGGRCCGQCCQHKNNKHDPQHDWSKRRTRSKSSIRRSGSGAKCQERFSNLAVSCRGSREMALASTLKPELRFQVRGMRPGKTGCLGLALFQLKSRVDGFQPSRLIEHRTAGIVSVSFDPRSRHAGVRCIPLQWLHDGDCCARTYV